MAGKTAEAIVRTKGNTYPGTILPEKSRRAGSPSRKPARIRRRVDWRGWVFMGPFVVVFVFVFVVPVVYAVYLSFFPAEDGWGDGCLRGWLITGGW